MRNASEKEEQEKKSIAFERKSMSLRIAMISITAALYIALGYLFQPISFLGIQFRVAELMVGMLILFPIEGMIGKIIGVFFVNLSSPLGPIDLISCIVNIPALYCIIAFRNRKRLKYLGGVLYAVIISLYVAIIINIVLGLPIWLIFLQVLISEVILANLGIILFETIKNRIELS
ncbi:MAG: QueT transporter family protein [Promethearchaeota archaeon]